MNDASLSRLGGLLLVLAVWLATVMVMAGSALAAGEHPYLSSRSLIGELHPNELCGVATDPNGDVYVAEGVGTHVLVYNSSVEFLTSFQTPGHPCDMAIDSTGDVYAKEGTAEGNIVKYKPSAFPPTKGTTYSTDESVVKGKGLIDNSKSASVAVDPVTQNVYVAEVIEELLGRVVEYDSNGVEVKEVVGVGAIPGAVYSSIGVDGATGDVYAVDAVHNKVYVFSPEGDILTTIDGTDVPDFPEGFGSLARAHLAVEQSTGDVYVGDVFSHGVVDQFTVSGGYVAQIGPTFGPNGSLRFEDPFHYQSVSAVDDSPTSPNDGDVFVLSQSNAGQSGSLYAFGPLTLTVSYALSVAERGGGSGSVTSEPSGIECGSVCLHEYEEGARVKLSAVPAPGSEFTGWSGCETEPAVGECEVTMSGALSVLANFSPVQRVLSVAKAGGGSQSWHATVTSSPAGIECGSLCSHSYDENTEVTLVASAASGSVFTGWSGGGCSGTGVCRVALGADTGVTANFADALPAVSVVPVFSFSERPLTTVGRPAGGGSGEAKGKTKRVLTRAQKLVVALGECRKRDGSRRVRRAVCERAARKRYGPVKGKAKK